MKAIEKIFCTVLFILSSLCLLATFLQIVNSGSEKGNLLVMMLFCFPVLLAFIYSGNLLINNQNNK